jgi:hypothetical protein
MWGDMGCLKNFIESQGQLFDCYIEIGLTLTAQYFNDLRVNVNPIFLRKLL